MSEIRDDPVMDKPKLFSSTMLMASGTLVSRILGMVRVLLVAYLLHSHTLQADTFSIASGIPTQMYMLVAGGILNAILVPQLMKSRRLDPDSGQAFSDRIVTLFVLMVTGLTAILLIANPLVVRLMTQPDWRVPTMEAQYGSLMTLTALLMPQVFFFGIFFLGGQILNSRGSFGPLMWAPALNNVIQVIMLGAYAVIWGFHTDTTVPFTRSQLLLLGIGSVMGVVCQTVILIPFLKKVGFRYKPRFDFFHTGLGSTAHLAKWALALVVIDQVNYVIVTRMAGVATLHGDGAGETVLNFALLIALLPHALFTVSLGTALLPSLSGLAVGQEWKRFTDQFMSSVRTIYAAIIPISLIMIAVGLPVGTIAFGGSGGTYIGRTLIVLTLGMIPITLRFLIMRGFNSMQNTRTPFFVEVVFVAITSALSIILVVVVKVPLTWVAPSIALGYTIGYLVSTVVAWILFRKIVPGVGGHSLTSHTVRLIAISIPSALVAAGVMAIHHGLTYGWGAKRFCEFCLIQSRSMYVITGVLGLATAGILGLGVYWGLAKLIKIPEIADLTNLIRSKLRKEQNVESSESDARVPVDDNETSALLGDPDVSPRRAIEDEGPPREDAPYLPNFSTDEAQPILTGLAPLVPGALIAERYRIAEMLGTLGSGSRWSGVDEGLSRPVLVTAFPNDENTAVSLEAARMASGAMDARFLRILDAGQDADGGYIVSESSDGRTLADLLKSGPLTGEESAWVVREVAAGLATAHAMQQYHCRIDPTKISITTSGGVKIAGLRVDQALAPRESDESLTRSDMEAMDVVACGGLLYACLTATWPGSANIGLSPSPRNPEGLKPPIQVRPGTSVALDRLTHQILSVKDPEHIETALGVAEALGLTLGSKDPTTSLAARVSLPVPEIAEAIPGQAERPRILPAHENDDASLTVDFSQEGTVLGGFMPEPPQSGPATRLKPPVPPNKARMWSRVFLGLVVLVVLALISTVVIGLYHSARNPTAPQTPVVTVTPRVISSAAVFDSKQDGGSGGENDELIGLAFDGDPTTVWPTEVYDVKEYGEVIIPERKPGVGLVFDLGAPVAVSQTTITIGLRPITVAVYVPSGDAASVTKPDMTTIRNWTPVIQSELTEAVTTLDFSSVTTQYVIIYITKPFEVSEGVTQADLAEVAFAG